MSARLITPPVAKPVTVEDLKQHCRIDHPDEDGSLAAYRDAAIALLDGYNGVLGRAIMPQTWRQEFAGWGSLRLSLPDVTSITVTYQDALGVMQPAASADLMFDASGFLVVADGPQTEMVRVDYTCAMPPQTLASAQQIIRMLVAAWFATREAVTGAPGTDVPLAAKTLIAALKWRRL